MLELEVFPVPHDSIAYTTKNFPPDCWECIPRIMSLLQNIKEDVMQRINIEKEDLHSHKTGRSPRHTLMVFMFATNYPKQFKGL